MLLMIIGVWTQLPVSTVAETPSWQGITPSKTTREEVMALLGEPDKIWQCVLRSEGLDLERFEQECERATGVINFGYSHERLADKAYGWHEIQFNADDTVDYIVELVWPNSDPETISVEEFLARYGSPEGVTWSLREVRSRGLLYCEQGLILHVVLVHGRDDEKDLRIEEVVYFAPMATDECVNKFFNEVGTTNPYEGSHVEGPLDPWGFQGAKP